MNVETTFYQIVGVKKESSRLKWQSVLAFEIFSKLDKLLNKTIIEGSLPEDGPAFVFSNHTGIWDVAKGYAIVKETGHRLMRCIARESLLDENLRESDDVLEITGKKSDPLTTAPKLLRRMLATIFRGIDAIGVPRGAQTFNALRPTIRECTRAFAEEQIVACFIQETRRKENDLRNLMNGPAFLARLHPDIPIYPVSVWSKSIPHKIRAGTPFSADDAFNHPNFRTGIDPTSALTLFIGDRIAEISEFEVRISWQVLDRKEFINSNKKL